jgi:HPt (histidine-containing phosphotransfer) domain-containing protein
MIDFKEIAEELDFDIEDVMMLIDMYLESAQDSIENIVVAIKANDLETIKNEAHAIKGSSANLKLDDIRILAKEIELSATENQAIDYHAVISKLYEKIELLKEAVTDYA